MNNLKLKNANDAKIAQQKLEEAQAFAKELETKTVVCKIKKGESGRTFGSVSTKEICHSWAMSWIKRKLFFVILLSFPEILALKLKFILR